MDKIYIGGLRDKGLAKKAVSLISESTNSPVIMNRHDGDGLWMLYFANHVDSGTKYFAGGIVAVMREGDKQCWLTRKLLCCMW